MLANKNDTMTNSTIGTFIWMAPEAINGGKIGFAADIWALSTLFWEVSPSQLTWSYEGGQAMGNQS